MEKGEGKNSLYGKLLSMTIVPLFLLALGIMFFSTHSMVEALNKEVKQGLMDLSTTILTLYDHLYPGDYSVATQNGEFYMLKGEHRINGDFSIIDTIKAETGTDITFFYQDTRVITTLYDEKGTRLVGTKVNAIVTRDVLVGKKPVFYPSVTIGTKEYFAYYVPIVNSDKTIIGMLFVAKPTEDVYNSVMDSVFPIVGIGLLAMLVTGLITIQFAKKLIRAIKKIEKFLEKVANGNLADSLDYEVAKRDDELGDMGRYAVNMQKALIELVEKDALTGLFNRRYGEKKLLEIQRDKVEKNVDFCIAIGDVDHFKRVNDTYGHECGDLVLAEVANIMKKAMYGEGFAARWGGEEFLLVFKDGNEENAICKLAAILDEIKEKEIVYNEQIVRITMTFGISRGNTDDIDSLICCADKKLYHGKNNGRNQIVR